MKISKFTKLGILIVASLAILIWGLSYLKGNDIFKKSNTYNVVYNRIEGLTSSNDVLLSGHKIGQVKNISFLPDNSGRLIVSFTIDSDIKLPVNTVAQIISSDLMGTRVIKINLGDKEGFYTPGDTIPGDVESDLKEQVSMQVLPLKNKAEELLGSLDSAITVLTVIFNEDARKNLSESFENINQTIYNIEKTTADFQSLVAGKKDNIERIITNFDNITTEISNSTEDFKSTMKNLSSLSDSLLQYPISHILKNISESTEKINDVIARLESSDNTAGLLLNDTQIYENLNILSGNLSMLTNDIRVNPERYLKFSAVDLGRKVYINSHEESSDNIIFKIHILSSENRLSTEAEIFKGLGEIEEYEVSGAYSYLTGSSNSFSKILNTHEKVLKKFPDATITAFKNGRLIKLEKALKSKH